MIKKITFFVLIALFVLQGQVFAQAKYNIKEMTPEVTTALESRRGRYDQLQQLKSQGVVGENNQGYVEVRGTDPGGALNLVEAENRDRKFIYNTIAQQNNLENALSTIEVVFAQVQREKASSGEWIQNEDGAWVKK